MKRIILITGGARSGKSRAAQELALSLSPNPIYIATARAWDDEFRARIRRHRADRGPEWTTIEADLDLSHIDIAGRVAVIDCLTLLTTNFYFDRQGRPIEQVLRAVRQELEAFTRQDATFIFVTNEVGMGGVPADAVQRHFMDLLGWVNQYVGSLADEVWLMVCGRAVCASSSHAAANLTGSAGFIPATASLTGSAGFIPATASSVRPREAAGINPALPVRVTREEIKAKLDNLNKPRGSMGRLEDLAMQIGLLQGTLSPRLTHPCHLLLGADHGIEREGVSVSPREVTWQQMINFTRGGGGVNMFCRQHHFDLTIVDVGVDHDLSAFPAIRQMKVRAGTRNFLHEAAMTPEEVDRCLAIGRELVDECEARGSNVISLGEMGIGNTSPSSLWMHLLTGIPLAQCVGAGAGLQADGIRHKLDVLQRSLARLTGSAGFIPATARLTGSAGVSPVNGCAGSSPLFIMQQYGGLEMVAAVGAMLRAAERHILILVDGFIMTACALMASRMSPDVLPACVFCHQGDESGHRLMLEAMGVKGLLNLGLRLGEGTGALCAYPIVESAVRMINEMNNFDDAGITKY